MKTMLISCAVVLAALVAQAEYTDDCVTFSSVAPFTLKTNNNAKNWDGTLWTSTDKTTWTAWKGAEVSAVQAGGKCNLYVRGNANTIITGPSAQLTGTDHYWVLTATGENKIACTGNIETLRGATGDAPATTPMSRMCYSCMFVGCTSLTSAPSLPATTLAGLCYEDMFAGCTSLTSAPKLPATKLAAKCYYEMFASCTSLTSAPELPATTLEGGCYGLMFCGCTSLVVNETAPGKEWKIPATSTTASSWGDYMFAGTAGTLQGQPELNTTYYIKSAPLPEGGPYKETVSGIEWQFIVMNGEAIVGTGIDKMSAYDTAVPTSTAGSITMPTTLGGRTVTGIGYGAFHDCKDLTGVVISPCVRTIYATGFSRCSGLSSLVIPPSVTSIGGAAFRGCSSLTSIAIPSSVTSIVTGIFSNCSTLYTIIVDKDNPNYKSVNGLLLTKDGKTLISGVNGNVVIPSTIDTISEYAFEGYCNLLSVTMPNGVTSIGAYAFSGCDGLTLVTIPSSVTSIGEQAFSSCSNVKEITFEGDAPATGDNVFLDTPVDMIIKVKNGSSGWIQWNGRKLVYEGGGGGTTAVTLTVTNVVVHYIQTSELSPMAAPITPDVGIVNVMTEIEGGIVAVPESWATNYPSFKQKFGNDFAVALTRETGKFDANRKPMRVWQDYVAGTDPTDVTDQFRASVTMVEGKPVISYTPVLSETEAAKRVYTIYGKVKLQDEEWTAVPERQEADYNFFKVTVKMK